MHVVTCFKPNRHILLLLCLIFWGNKAGLFLMKEKSLCQVNQSAQWRKLLMYLFYKTKKKQKPCGFVKKSSKIVASNLLIDNKNHELRCN